MDNGNRRPNYLIHEQSPYLLQHACQPVNWYPWGETAFQIAKEKDKPILLSSGYSSCHWCHVMARESFEDEEIAAFVNENFVNIKVDREERPDVDAIYQTVCQLITGYGGWPLTVFLTPDLKPFYAGTYFPPKDQHGRTGFLNLLRQISRMYREERERVEEIARQVLNSIRNEMELPKFYADVDSSSEWSSIPVDAVQQLKYYYDTRHGGFGAAPKFPTVNLLRLFLEVGIRENPAFVDMVLETLQRMARGGIFDQLGGGFHRYATDDRWLIPHFEKMLYDNALLVPLYLSAYQITGDSFFRQVAEATLTWVEREMTSPEGGFYSSLDADSEGEEGKFYVWTESQIKEILGDEIGRIVCDYFGVTATGNFEKGTSVLHIAKSSQQLAEQLNCTVQSTEELIKAAKVKLFAEREKRVRPFRDEKIITAWNGMMISAFAQAARILRRPEYAQTAQTALDFILSRLVFSDGTLRRSYKETASQVPGFLEDYAYIINAALDIYEINFEHKYLIKARDLADVMLEKFWDEIGIFYETTVEHQGLIVRPQSGVDQSIPSGVSQAVLALMRLAELDDGFASVVEGVFRAYSDAMVHNPWGYAALIGALNWWQSGTVQVMLVGSPDDVQFQQLREVCDAFYVPHMVLHGLTPGWKESWQRSKWNPPAAWVSRSDAFRGEAVAYVCQNFTCSPPVTDPERLRELLMGTVGKTFSYFST